MLPDPGELAASEQAQIDAAGEARLEAHQPGLDLVVRKEYTPPPPWQVDDNTAAPVDCGIGLYFTGAQCLGGVAAAGLHLRHPHC